MLQVLAYSGVFLTAASQQKLLAAAPAQHVHVHCDHVTLDYRPSLQQVSSFVPSFATTADHTNRVAPCNL